MGHKLLALYRHRSRLSKLIIMTRVPLELLGENSETVNHISALDNMQFVYSIGIFLSTAVTASFFVLRPPIHVLLNRGKHSNDSDAQLPDDDPLLPLKMVVPIPKGYEEKFWVYVSLYTYHSLLSFYHILGFPGVDGFYAGLVLHAAARLHLLRMAFGRLRGDANELTEGNARRDCPIVHLLWMEDQTAEQVQVEVGEEVRLQGMLAHRVRQHQEILSYINQVEEVVNSLMMSQFFMSSSVIPCTAYQVVNFPGDIVNVTINMAFLLGALLQLGAYCYFGDYVKQESDAVGESMYFGDWVGAGRAHASSLRIVIMRCQAPTRFTIGRFSELSLATYDSILRGCYTYFTLLNDMSD